jgi:DNA-binding MarR family transcriptional regulator
MSTDSTPPPAGEVAPALVDAWGRLMTLFTAKRDAFLSLMRDYRLTPPHGIAIAQLVDGPLRMRDLADTMHCDASYITAIVDRLEQEGLATRQPSSDDRRVKEIALTERGRKVGTALNGAFTDPPKQLKRLSPHEQTQLAALLAKLVPADEIVRSPFRLDSRNRPSE